MTNETISDLTFQIYLGRMERENPSESWVAQDYDIEGSPLPRKQQRKIEAFYHHLSLENLRFFCTMPTMPKWDGIEATLTTPQAIEEAILKYKL